MPFVNEDGSLDTWKGYIMKCDNCGFVERIFDENINSSIGRGEETHRLENEIRNLFRGVRKPDIPDVLCVDCLKKVMPNLHKLRDVIELDIFVSRLGKAINEKRKQRTENNGPIKDNACECCKRCPKWRLRYRTCNSTSQAGKEHQ